MNLQELRIGNYYKWYADGKDYYYTVEAKDFANDNYKNFQPIELTEEILLKCGFEVNIDIYYLPKMNGYFKKPFKGADHFLYKSNGGDKLSSVKHLHQLQNLYWCLCGEELNIEL